MQGELQASKVERVVRNRIFIYKGLSVASFFSHPTLDINNHKTVSNEKDMNDLSN